MIRHLFAALVIVVSALLLLLAAWPQLFGLQWQPGIAQVVSLRGLAVAIAIALLVLVLLVAAVFRPARRLAVSLALLLVVFCAVSLAVLATRGFGGDAFEAKGDESLTVLSWNTLGDAPGAAAIAELALDADADIVALPETSRETGIAVAELMGEAGSPMQPYTTSFDEISKARSTTLLLSSALGGYTVASGVGNTSTLPTVVATPDDGEGPTIIAVHPVAPIKGEMSDWRSDLRWLAGICTGPDVIMAGDFNSTLDHFGRLAASPGASVGGCADAASANGSAAVGTWPTRLPALLGSPIDHVMATANWRFSGMRVVTDRDEAGSDHRPIVAQLNPAG